MTSTLSPFDTCNRSLPMSTSQSTRQGSRSSSSQRSSRIEKPKSNHNSPRVLERRKTTSGTKRYATLDDHYNMMFGIQTEDQDSQQKGSSRPMSWHPASAQFQVPSRSSILEDQASPVDWTRHNSSSSRNSAHGSDFYSLSARNSMHPEQMQNFPSFDSTPPTENRGSQSSEGSWQSVSQQPPYTVSAYSTPATESMPWYLSEWAKKTQAQATTPQHGSTDFLPIQRPATEYDDNEDEEMEDSGKELVGMGLYDMPESSQGWALTESTGKGLKLEETWQPPEEGEDDEDDASSDDGSVDELQPVVQKETAPPVSAVKPQVQENMEGQSFFFNDDEDESYTKEWWFHQLKQPSVPVRDAGLGYGWL